MCVCVSDVLDVMLDDIVCGRMGGQAGGRKEEGADTALKTKTPHVNVGKKLLNHVAKICQTWTKGALRSGPLP